MNIQPQYDVVAVTFGAREDKTAFGILLPNAGRPEFATVVAVGPGYTRDDGQITPLAVKVGDRVFVGDNSSEGVIHDPDQDQEIHLFRAPSILAVIAPEAEAKDPSEEQ